MKASDLTEAQSMIYDIEYLQNRVDTLTQTYIAPAAVGEQPKTTLYMGDLSFGFLMTEPIYLEIKKQLEDEIAKMTARLKEIGVEL